MEYGRLKYCRIAQLSAQVSLLREFERLFFKKTTTILTEGLE